MGWKNIQEFYRIGHIVQWREGTLRIGSAYISDLITIDSDGAVHAKDGWSRNEDLARYLREMHDDPAKLRELLNAPDTFVASLPVNTYDGGDILEKQCEKYGWLNRTHDGLVMYENTFSPDRAQVIAWAKRNAQAGVEMATRRLAEIEENRVQVEAWRDRDLADLAKLDAMS